MKPGQRLTRWWQLLTLGRLKTPQDLIAASRQEEPDQAQSWMRVLADYQDNASWDVPQRLKAPAWLAPSNSMLKQWAKADWQQCDYRLMLFSAVLQELARKRGIPLYVHCAFRSQSDQEREFVEGNSKLRWPNGAHNIGEAVDIVHAAFHWSLTDLEWRFLGLLGREAERLVNGRLVKDRKFTLNWGGDDGPGDKFRWDPAHWELADYRSRTRPLKTGQPVRYTPRGILAQGLI